MLRIADAAPVVGALGAGLAAVLGGAFSPTPRLGATLVLAAAVLLAVGALRGAPRAEESWLLAVLVWAGAVATVQGLSPLAGKETVAAWLVAVGLWAAARRSREPARLAAGLVLLTAAVAVAVAVIGEWLALGQPRAGGLLENPNVAAALLAPTAVAVWGLRGSVLPRWLAPVLSATFAAAILATGSRAALVALAAAAVMIPLRPRARVAVAIAGLVLVAGAVAWRLAVQRDVFAWHRVTIWRSVVHTALEHPWTGVGPGAWADVAGRARITYPDSLARHEMRPTYAESTPIGILAELGLIGLSLSAAAATAAWRAARRRGGGRLGRLAALLATMAVIASLHDLLRVEVVLWWWAVLVGLTEPLVGREPGRRSRWGWLAGVAAAALVLWGLAAPAEARRRWQALGGPASCDAVEAAIRAEPWLSGPAVQRAAALAAGGSWAWAEAAEACAWAERAVAAHPGSVEAWTILSRAGARTIVELGGSRRTVARTREAFARATSLEPHLPWGWLEWARLERSLGDLTTARTLAERAVTEEPAFVRGWLLLARIELDLGQVPAAAEATERARRAAAIRRPRRLSSYERELLELPLWQLEQLDRALR